MALVQVKHSKVVTVPDDGTSPVGSDEWNANHTITGLENVDNTSDANKPVSTAQAAAIAAGVAGVTKASIGLGSVDNTSDVNKPVSTAQAAAIAASSVPPATSAPLMDGAAAVGAVAKYAREDHVHPVDTSRAAANYTQVETGAVSSPLIRRLNNTLFASEFGAVGDDATNDYAALQAWLNAVASSHKEGRLDPGKKYFVSGADLTFTALVGGGSVGLYGMGSMVRTDPAQNRIGLIVTWNFTGGTRVDASSITLIDGWTINHFQDANALWGMKFLGITGAGNLILRNNRFAAGGDIGGNGVNYSAMRFEQGTNTDPNTAIFWTEIENCRLKGGTNAIPNGVWFVGGHNATSITKNTFSNIDCAIKFEAANRLGAVNANNGVISNAVKVLDNSFESIQDGIKFIGISTISRSVGLQVQNNRVENIRAGGSAFFNYGLDVFSEAAPVLGPNYVNSSDLAKYIFNPNSLQIRLFDNVGGGYDLSATVAVTGTTTLTTLGFGKLYLISGTAANYTVTLPTPVGNAGAMMAFMVDLPANASKLYTLSTPSGVIGRQGAAFVMWASETVVLRSDGTNWQVVAGQPRPFTGTFTKTTDQAYTSGLTFVPVTFNNAGSGDPTGLNLAYVSSSFQAPRKAVYTFNSFIYGTATSGGTFLQTQIGVTSGPVVQNFGAITGGTCINAAQGVISAGAAVNLTVRSDATSPVVSGSQVTCSLSFVEIPSW